MRRKWTKETITTAIIGLHHSGDSLSYTSVMNDERALLQAATRYYGTWEAAVTSSGFDYDSYRRHRKPVETVGADIVYRRRQRRKIKPTLSG
jgi:hypothetical protein